MWTKLEFRGFAEDASDFGSLVAAAGLQVPRQRLVEFIDAVIHRIANPMPGRTKVIVVVGYANPNASAALDPVQLAHGRVASTISWIKAQLAARAAAQGVAPGDWENVPWLLKWGIPAGSGRLVHDNPTTEAQRRENGRVIVRIAELPADGFDILGGAGEGAAADDLWWG